MFLGRQYLPGTIYDGDTASPMFYPREWLTIFASAAASIGKMYYGMVLALCGVRHIGGIIMHDPALWASWYLWLLTFPALVIGILVRDWVQRRQPARVRRRR